MKLVIIGQPGAGKSTLAREIAEKTHWPLLHLDKIWHTTDYSKEAKIWFFDQQKEFMKKNTNWIIDGNFQGTMDLRIKGADVILWMKTSRLKSLYRTLKRSIKRRYFHQKRQDMADEFEEKWDREYVEFLRFIWHFKENNEEKIMNLLKQYPDKKVIIINNTKDKYNFLEQLKKASL